MGPHLPTWAPYLLCHLISRAAAAGWQHLLRADWWVLLWLVVVVNICTKLCMYNICSIFSIFFFCKKYICLLGPPGASALGSPWIKLALFMMLHIHNCLSLYKPACLLPVPFYQFIFQSFFMNLFLLSGNSVLQMCKQFAEAGYMADADLDSSCLLNKKIRNAQVAQYNFILGKTDYYSRFFFAIHIFMTFTITMLFASKSPQIFSDFLSCQKHDCTYHYWNVVKNVNVLGQLCVCCDLAVWGLWATLCFVSWQWSVRKRSWLTAWTYVRGTTRFMESCLSLRCWLAWPCWKSHVAGTLRRSSER